MSGVGGLLALIGIVLLFLGRDGFDERHRNGVVLGGALLLISVIATIVIAVAVVAAILSSAHVPGATIQDVADSVVTTLDNAAGAAIVVAAIGGIGQILMVYNLADPTSRWLLWAGLVVGIVLAAALYSIELPQIAAAFRAATSSGTYNSGPITQLQTQLQIDGLLRIIPSAISSFAYYRVWRKLDETVRPPALPIGF